LNEGFFFTNSAADLEMFFPFSKISSDLFDDLEVDRFSFEGRVEIDQVEPFGARVDLFAMSRDLRINGC
jgi:hypothetical protein